VLEFSGDNTEQDSENEQPEIPQPPVGDNPSDVTVHDSDELYTDDRPLGA
jgi:hypothetical protein